MFTRNVLVTGSNRGIGLEFVRQLAGKTEIVFAGCRTVSKELKELSADHKNIVIVQLDVTKQDDIDTAFAKVNDAIKDTGLNCLINNAGIVNYEHTSIEKVTADALMFTYNVNTVGPAMITKAFLPLLRQASKTYVDGEEMNCRRAAILNVSSRTGSIEDNSSAKLYGSRLSKVALNMLTKNLSIELKDERILCAAINPGWVKTDNGGSDALMTTQESVDRMLTVFDTLSDTSTGKFLSWDGQVLPW